VELLAVGRAYRCFCSPERLELDRGQALAEGRAPKYVGRCRDIERSEARRRIASGEQAVIRLRVDEQRDVVFTDLVRGEVRFHSSVIGDPVLMRSNGYPAFNFAVVIDDALMGISHVVRGEDHISNTPRQLLVYEAFGWTPPAFAHVAMVLGPDHTKLSKRHGATSVAEFRAKGYLPEALANYLALLGWSPGDDQEIAPLDDLARRFSLDAVGLSAGVFDEDKLAWVNRHHLKSADPARIVSLSLPYLARAGWVGEPSGAGEAFLASILPVTAASVDRLEQVPARVRFLFEFDATAVVGDPVRRDELVQARPVLEALAADLHGGAVMDTTESFRAVAGRVRASTGQKGRALFHPLRLALTGEAEGMELDHAVPAIERGAALGGAGLALIVGASARVTAILAALDRS
jgi:glutamyl-tRNA synthetase/nondiscriminating glutamyl-tRNA synthetase